MTSLILAIAAAVGSPPSDPSSSVPGAQQTHASRPISGGSPRPPVRLKRICSVSFSQKAGEQFPFSVSCLAFSPDGKLLAAGDMFGGLCLVDTATWRESGRLAGHGERASQCYVWETSFTGDGKTLVSLGDDGRTRLWEVATLGERLVLKTRDVSEFALSPDGRLLSADDTGLFFGGKRLWDLTTGRQLRPPPELRFGESAVYSPDASVLAVGSDGKIFLLEPATFKVLATLKVKTAIVRALAFSHDGSLLAMGGERPSVYLWDTRRRKQRAAWRTPGEYIERISISGDGKYAAFRCLGVDKIVVMDVTTGQIVDSLATQDRVFAFGPRGTTLAIRNGTAGIDIFELFPEK